MRPEDPPCLTDRGPSPGSPGRVLERQRPGRTPGGQGTSETRRGDRIPRRTLMCEWSVCGAGTESFPEVPGSQNYLYGAEVLLWLQQCRNGRVCHWTRRGHTDRNAGSFSSDMETSKNTQHEHSMSWRRRPKHLMGPAVLTVASKGVKQGGRDTNCLSKVSRNEGFK